MFSNLKNKLTGDKKILILFSILFIFNVALFINLFAYMVIIKNINASVLHDLVTVISAIIILGFISTRLTKLKEVISLRISLKKNKKKKTKYGKNVIKHRSFQYYMIMNN